MPTYLDIPCPSCHVPQSVVCRHKSGTFERTPSGLIHQTRIQAAEKVARLAQHEQSFEATRTALASKSRVVDAMLARAVKRIEAELFATSPEATEDLKRVLFADGERLVRHEPMGTCAPMGAGHHEIAVPPFVVDSPQSSESQSSQELLARPLGGGYHEQPAPIFEVILQSPVSSKSEMMPEPASAACIPPKPSNSDPDCE